MFVCYRISHPWHVKYLEAGWRNVSQYFGLQQIWSLTTHWNNCGFLIFIPGVRNVLKSQEGFLMLNIFFFTLFTVSQYFGPTSCFLVNCLEKVIGKTNYFLDVSIKEGRTPEQEQTPRTHEYIKYPVRTNWSFIPGCNNRKHVPMALQGPRPPLSVHGPKILRFSQNLHFLWPDFSHISYDRTFLRKFCQHFSKYFFKFPPPKMHFWTKKNWRFSQNWHFLWPDFS